MEKLTLRQFADVIKALVEADMPKEAGFTLKVVESGDKEKADGQKVELVCTKEEKKEDNVVSFSDDVFPEKNEMHTVKMPDMFSENTVSEKPQGLDKIDFEKQLEESLKDL